MMKEYDGRCILEMGTQTNAQKAQSALSAAAIPSTVVKTESSSRRGCVYGIRFSCSQAANVRTVLSAARITVRRWDIEG